MKDRLSQLWAFLTGTFWLPCPSCSRMSSGARWQRMGSPSVSTGRPGIAQGVCSWACADGPPSVAAAVQLLLGMSEEPMKAWELHRAIGGSRSELDATLDRLESTGTVTRDQHGYYGWARKNVQP